MAARDRSIRVFVSSTFRDMQGEREELVKRVFPELRRRCEQRGVAWSEIDLRWGVTDEAKAEGAVLPICLREIELSRPYFIGMLGQRYGWVPDAIPPDLAAQEGWLDEDRGRSVTELEILHGVLNDPSMEGHAFFYLRDEAWAESLPADERATYVDDDPVAQQRLAALRDRLRTSGFPVRDYDDPRAIGDAVAADLGALIDELFPPETPTDAGARDEGAHRAFADARFAGFVPRPALTAAVDQAVAAGPTLVSGAEGAGKSALVAAWARDLPDTFVHHVGANADSGRWAAIVRRLLRWLGGDGSTDLDELPDDALPARLVRALNGREATVVLDGVDQLEADDRLPLFWLPEVMPAGVRLVVTAGAGPALDELRRRGWAEVALTPLSTDERRTLTTTFLSRWSKALDVVHVDRLAAAPQTGNPLYLRTVLDELRQWGDHFTLGERIDAHLAAGDLDGLLAFVLARYASDFDRDRPSLTQDAMRMLWAGHRGVTEAELLDGLGDAAGPLPRAAWSPLFLAAEANLLAHDGRYRFSHAAMRRAVEARFVMSEAARRDSHSALADLLDGELTPRVVEELPHQLAGAERWDDLASWLARPDAFDATYRRSLPDLHALWTRLETSSSHRVTDAYAPLADDGALGFQVAVLLAGHGHLRAAITATDASIVSIRAGGTRRRLIGLLLNRGAWQVQTDDLIGAGAAFREALDLARAEADRFLEQTAVGGLATVLRAQRDGDGALALLREQEAIATERDDLEGREMAVANQGSVLLDRSDFTGAAERYAEAERLARQHGDPSLLGQVLSAQASVLAAQGRVDEAIARHAEHAVTARAGGDRYGLSIALGNQAVALLSLGRLDVAAPLLDESTALARAIGDQDGLARNLLLGATITHRAGDTTRALALLDEHATVCESIGDQASLANGIGERATILREQGDLDGAARLHQQEQQLHEAARSATGVATSIGNQALVAFARNDIAGGLALLAQQERRCREAGWTEGLITALGNHASVAMQRGQLDDAEAALRELEGLHRAAGNAAGLGGALQNLALVAHGRGDYAAALALTEEQLPLSQQGSDGMGVIMGTANKGELLCRLGRTGEGLAALSQAEQWAQQNGLAPLAHQIAALAATFRTS